MRTRKKQSSSKSLVLALVLLVALIACIYIIQRIVTDGIPSDKLSAYTGSLGLAENNYIQFDTLQQEEYKAPLAGFWESRRDTTIENIALKVTDRIEIKQNGYIWQVIRYFTPTDSTGTLHVVNSYALPYGLVKKDTTQIVVQIRLIRQVYLAAADSGYGESNLDLVSTIQRSGDTLSIDHRVYTKWKEQNIASFFPPKTLGWVDSVRLSQCNTPSITLTRPFKK
jgi:hypothetical protein